jgi:succinoglycan biosynthesis protein ExoL
MKRPKILYLAHDLSDAAVHKRVSMLRDGGAILTVAGFRRTPRPVENVAGYTPVDLGQTHNGRLAQRAWTVLHHMLFPSRHAAFREAEIVIARNLEMLAIAARHAVGRRSPVLVYESLDVHRLLLNKSAVGHLLRRIEDRLLKKSAALITSSPAFIDAYFSRYPIPVYLVENKVYDPQGKIPVENVWPARPVGPPWKIGWFGVIRCHKSLRLLADIAIRSRGAVEIIIRGRPALDEIPDFHDVVSCTSGMHFLGAYEYPQELPGIYRDIHFTWAVDFYEEGGNSSLLLPNRLYEGGLFDAVPIALKSVATGRFLDSRDIGVTLSSPLQKSLPSFFDALTEEQYRMLEKRAAKTPRMQWSHAKSDCQSLVNYLMSLQSPVAGNAYA